VRTYASKKAKAGRARRRYLTCKACGHRFHVDLAPPAQRAEEELVGAGLTIADVQRLASYFVKRFDIPPDLRADARQVYLLGLLRGAARLEPGHEGSRTFLYKYASGHLRRFLQEQRRRQPVSLDAEGQPGEADTFGALIPDPSTSDPRKDAERAELRAILDEAIHKVLSARDAQILRLRMEGHVQEDIAREVGLTHSRVYQIEKAALVRLRHYLGAVRPELAAGYDDGPPPRARGALRTLDRHQALTPGAWRVRVKGR